LANADQFSTFFHQLIRKEIVCDSHKDFHLTYNTLPQYLVKVENPKKMLLILTASSTN